MLQFLSKDAFWTMTNGSNSEEVSLPLHSLYSRNPKLRRNGASYLMILSPHFLEKQAEQARKEYSLGLTNDLDELAMKLLALC